MYSNKQRKNIIKMLKKTKKDINTLDKKLDKIKLWLDVYETLLYATDVEYVEEEELQEEEESDSQSEETLDEDKKEE